MVCLKGVCVSPVPVFVADAVVELAPFPFQTGRGLEPYAPKTLKQQSAFPIG